MSYRRVYKDNSRSKSFWGGVLAFVLLVVISVVAVTISNVIEDNQTQEIENESGTQTEITPEIEVVE